MRSRPLSRRALLRGAGGVALALPFLEGMTGCRPVGAAPVPSPLGRAGQTLDGFPKRLVIFAQPGGMVYDNWKPTGGEYDFVLSPSLEPLAPIRSKTIILNGVDLKGQYPGGALAGHDAGYAGMLTGRELLPGTFSGAGHELIGYPNGHSVDQELAQKIGHLTRFRSLELGVQTEDKRTDVAGRMCYRAVNEPLPPEPNPYALFARLFGDVDGSRPNLQQLRVQRRSILDTVLADYRSLLPRLGGEDRRRVEAHLDHVRDLERQLNAPSPVGSACRPPEVGTPIDFRANDNYPVVGKLQMDLLAMALACDLTRVASLQWHLCASWKRFTWLGINEFHHEYTHKGDYDADAKDKLTRIFRWYAEQVTYLAQKLDSIPEGTGTVLDNTVILWCNEMQKGNTHVLWNAPFVLIGGCGGAFRTGRYLLYPQTLRSGIHLAGSRPHNNLLVSILNAMGVPATTFGKPEWCTGPLDGLS